VEIDDLLMLAMNWQSTSPLGSALITLGLPAMAVPEPTPTACVSAFLAAVASRRRRRDRTGGAA
jgi:hypothetical protein